ncbi:MAG: glutathione-disulfide reductase, partial [Tagaea sp.]|nr:glutathione-disulfide reductase [Tagaea sp.]
MDAFDYDLFTIGAGSGGVAGSRRAASYGARVAIAESWRIGGTCVLRGCVPKKLLVYGSHFAHEMEDARGYGWNVEGALDWGKLIAAKNRETDRLEGIYKNLLAGSKVETILGHAKIVAPNTVEVAGRTVTAKYILIATGGRPELPAIPGIEHAITSNEALDLPALPKRVAIVGGGYIAVEFAGIFRSAGAEVSVLIRGDKILRGFDGDARDHLAAEMTKQGIAIKPGTRVSRIDKAGNELRLTTEAGETLVVDAVMYATGRVPNTGGLGLETVGVHIDKAGGIAVDEWRQTTVPGIYAVGDVTNRVQLTPVAIAEARGMAETLFNSNPTPTDHGDIPSAVFSQPPIGTVGLSQEAAERLFGVDGVDIYRATFRPMKHTLSGRDEKTMMKLVVEAATGRVRGVHMVGSDA